MTSDGTNAFAWDAANRMIKITYPGTNNFSSFVYDGKGKNVSIVETTAGSVTSTKQFVWSGVKMREERDGSGTLTRKFFKAGQLNASTKYFYANDHLTGVRGLTDNSGADQAEFNYGPFGQMTQIFGTATSDFGFAGYYVHSRSGLNPTLFRSYNPNLSRWLNRDPVGEIYGPNLFDYVGNDPIRLYDPFGLVGSFPRPQPGKPNCPGDDDPDSCKSKCHKFGTHTEIFRQCMFVCLGQHLPGWQGCAESCTGWGEPWTAGWIGCMYICLGGDDED